MNMVTAMVEVHVYMIQLIQLRRELEKSSQRQNNSIKKQSMSRRLTIKKELGKG